MTSTESNPSTTPQRKAAFRRLLLAGTCAAFTALASATIASAQVVGFMPDAYFDEPEPMIQPRKVVRHLQNHGFLEISRPRFDGRAYVIEATHPSGSRMRLFVDAYDGAMLGRRVIGQTYPSQAYPPHQRVARAAPGYGWTEDDPALRQGGREFGGPIPPAEIPMQASRAPRRDAALRAGGPAQLGSPDAGPYGVNPDGKTRPGSAARKTARMTQPQKPAQSHTVPPAPEAKLDSPPVTVPTDGTVTEKRDAAIPSEAKPADIKSTDTKREGADIDAGRTRADDAKSDAAKSESSSPDSARTGQSAAETPGASESATTEVAGPAQVTPAANQPAAADKDASETPRDQAWKDIGPSKKNVRVIDGATVVPGTEAAPSGTN